MFSIDSSEYHVFAYPPLMSLKIEKLAPRPGVGMSSLSSTQRHASVAFCGPENLALIDHIMLKNSQVWKNVFSPENCMLFCDREARISMALIPLTSQIIM